MQASAVGFGRRISLMSVSWEIEELRGLLGAIGRKLEHMERQGERIMSGVDDLNAAVAALTTAVNTEIQEVQTVIAALQAGGITDAQAEQLAQTLQGSVTNLNNETTTLQGVVPPPPPPAG